MINSKILEGWRFLTLKEISDPNDKFSFKGGPFGSDLKSAHYTESGVRVLQLQDIGKGYFLDKSKIYTSVEKADELEACNVYPGDILLAKMSPVARCCIVPDTDERFVMCSDGIRLSVDQSKVDRDFVYYALNDKNFLDKAEAKSTGTTRARIGLSDLRSLAIYCPPLAEQRRIAEILSSVNEKIELIDQNINQTRQLNVGLIQRLFSKGVGILDGDNNWRQHTEFRDSLFGPIPSIWEISKLGECVTKVGSGVTPKGGRKAYLETGVPLIRSQNVLFGKFKLDDVAFISDYQHEKMKGSQLQARDVLLNITGASIGRCAVLPKDFDEGNVNQHVCIIRTIKDIIPEFMGLFLNSYLGQKQIWSLQAGGNREGLNFQQIRSFVIPVLPQNEQQAIIDICFTVDAKLDLLEQQKRETQQLKKGLMQKLLTGEWRIPLDDSEAA